MVLLPPNAQQREKLQEALNKDPETLDKNLEDIRKWLKKQPHLPSETWDEDCLRNFFLGCCCCVKTCKEKLENYFTVRATMPQFFNNRDIRNKELVKIFEIGRATVLPHLTPEGSRVSLLKPNEDLTVLPDMNDVFKMVFMFGDLRIKLEEGVTDLYILDLNFPLSRVFYQMSLQAVKNFFFCVHKAFPVHITQVHLINAPYIVYYLINYLFKPFLGHNLRNRIYVHTGIETLYDFVPKEILPEEYGGNVGKLKDLQDKCVQMLEDYSWWFKEQENVKADLEKKRKKKVDDDFD